MSQIPDNGSRATAIERRIDKGITGGIGMNAQRGMVIQSLDQAMEFAKVMAISEQAVPKHLRGNPGACLAIAIQGYEWSINPFALANKSYVVNDRLAYESALYHAVVQRRAPIKGRVKQAFDGKDGTRTCRVWAELDDGSGDIVEYTSPEFQRIPVKNSPLWKADPDQQLFYYAVRSFARRHFPDVMMGIYTVDEIQEAPPIVGDSPAGSRTSALADKLGITSRPVSEGQSFTPAADAQEQVAAQDAHIGEVIDPDTGEATAPQAQEPAEPVAEATAAVEVPPLPTLGSDVTLNQGKWRKVMDDAAANYTPSVYEAAINAAIKSCGGAAKMTPADRVRLYGELVRGDGAFA